MRRERGRACRAAGPADGSGTVTDEEREENSGTVGSGSIAIGGGSELRGCAVLGTRAIYGLGQSGANRHTGVIREASPTCHKIAVR